MSADAASLTKEECPCRHMGYVHGFSRARSDAGSVTAKRLRFQANTDRGVKQTVLLSRLECMFAP